MNDITIVLAILITAALVILGYYIYQSAKKHVNLEEEYSTLREVEQAVSLYIVEQTKEPDLLEDYSEEDLKRLRKKCIRARAATKGAPNGNRDDKLFIKNIIYGWVMDNLPMSKVRELLGFTDDTEPDHNTMFEIILMKYQQEYGLDAFKQWITENDFDKPRPAVGVARKGDKAYYVTKADLENSFHKLRYNLSDKEYVDVLVTKIYERVMGWGVIDTLTEMNFNGYNIGVSGSLMQKSHSNNENKDYDSNATNSFWVYFNSNYIHLQFINFKTETEIMRITQLLIRYKSPGPLTTKNGFRINTMWDKSRILAVRPDNGECWGTFVRKFTLDISTPEELIVKKGRKNSEVVAKFIEYLMVGKITTAVTGRQGSGKTTLMKAIMGYLPTAWNLRVLEAAPELYLRDLFPGRNIFSAQESDMVSMEALQDAFKKSDAMVTLIGEVATDIVAARMIQLAMTGSEMTIFSHHANSAKDLVITIRNSLVNACGFDNMQTAEKQVTDVLKIQVALGFKEGRRFVERITEIVQNEEGVGYPEYDPSDPQRSMYELQKEYYYRQTDRISFTTRDLIKYNFEENSYEIGEQMTDYLYNKILNNLGSEDKKEFKQFIAFYWGLPGQEPSVIDGYMGVPEYKEAKEEVIDNQIYSFDEAIDFLTDNQSSDSDN